MPDKRPLVKALTVGAVKAGYPAIQYSSPTRPEMVVLDPERGLLCVQVQDPWNGESVDEAFQSLNIKMQAFRRELPKEFHSTLRAHVVPSARFKAAALSDPRRVNSIGIGWTEEIALAGVDAQLAAALRTYLSPTTVFEARIRTVAEDPEQAVRAAGRFALDESQAAYATMPIKDVAVIDGPAGSGKTLVLIARAKWLAEEHPDWIIRVLCFNHGLVPYLESRLEDYPSVTVMQFGKFASRNGFRVRMSGTDSMSVEDFDRANKQTIVPFADALLIDEVQDFATGWLRWALAGLFPGRGGALLVGDASQALYRDVDLGVALGGRNVQHFHLGHPYRSTRQILEAVEVMAPGLAVENSHAAPDGVPVESVWASGPTEMARAMIWEVRRYQAMGIPLGQIGILVINGYQVSAIAGVFQREAPEIRVQPVWDPKVSPVNVKDVSVKILTVNGAKGYEFEAVLAAGLDSVKDPLEPGIDDGERESRRQFERNVLVGPSRAGDRLVIYYTRTNKYVSRLSEAGSSVVPYVWPDDFGATE